jgi:hypothetical protein
VLYDGLQEQLRKIVLKLRKISPNCSLAGVECQTPHHKFIKYTYYQFLINLWHNLVRNFYNNKILGGNNMFFGWQGIATLVGILVVVSLILYVFSKWLEKN